MTFRNLIGTSCDEFSRVEVVPTMKKRTADYRILQSQTLSIEQQFVEVWFFSFDTPHSIFAFSEYRFRFDWPLHE